MFGVKATSDNETTRGILFSSLECNDRFAALGANFFGMPYKVADMERRYYVKGEKEHNDEEIFPDDNVTHSNSRSIQKYKLSSVRSLRQSSLMNLILSIIMPVFRFFLFLPSDSSTKAAATSSFTIECEWERRSQHKENDSSSLTKFFVERYYVYTRRYGLNWRGQVEHDPWPVERAHLTKLTLSNIDQYEPTAMQPLIQFMATTPPESVLFSPGVGPVEFQLLRPV